MFFITSIIRPLVRSAALLTNMLCSSSRSKDKLSQNFQIHTLRFCQRIIRPKSNRRLARRLFCWKETFYFHTVPRPQGSACQSVWELLLQIPYGEVNTYGDIAQEIAAQRGIAKMSSQAIGGAVGHNPIPIIIPCHRVIGANGNLTATAVGSI